MLEIRQRIANKCLWLPTSTEIWNWEVEKTLFPCIPPLFPPLITYLQWWWCLILITRNTFLLGYLTVILCIVNHHITFISIWQLFQWGPTILIVEARNRTFCSYLSLYHLDAHLEVISTISSLPESDDRHFQATTNKQNKVCIGLCICSHVVQLHLNLSRRCVSISYVRSPK